jgi:hypothetical protein
VTFQRKALVLKTSRGSSRLFASTRAALVHLHFFLSTLATELTVGHDVALGFRPAT